MSLLDAPGPEPFLAGSSGENAIDATTPHRAPEAAVPSTDTGGVASNGAGNGHHPPVAGNNHRTLGASTGTERAGRRRIGATQLRTGVVTGLRAVSELRPQWLALYGSSDLGNPHLHPDWLLSWYATFVPDQDVLAVTVSAGDQLVGIAPLWRMRPGRRHGPVLCLQLAGAGRDVHLVDLPGVLTDTDLHRKAVAAMGPALGTLDGHWSTLTLAPEQGWSDMLLPQDVATVVPRSGRTSPVTPLDALGGGFADGLKRNVRESLRRARNRLDRTGHAWSIDSLTPRDEGFAQALKDLIDLHSTRAALPGRPLHLDALADPRQAQFLRTAAATAGAADHLQIFRLLVAGRTMASLLVLFSPTAAMLSVSGMAPDAWEYSPMALLIRAAAQSAAERGCHELNHSPGPDVSKLRWTDTMRTHHEFHLARTDLASRLAFGAFIQVAAGLGVRRERRRGRAPVGGVAPT